MGWQETLIEFAAKILGIERRLDRLESIEFPAIGGGPPAVGAPNDAQYVTLALDAGLTAERVLTEGPDIDLVDTGANGTITVGRGGDTVLVFHANGNPVGEFAATAAGLQAAHDDAGTLTGDVIMLPPRTIANVQLVISKSISVIGLVSQGGSSVLTGAAGVNAIEVSGANISVRLQGFSVTGGTGGRAIWVHGATTTCTISGISSTGDAINVNGIDASNGCTLWVTFSLATGYNGLCAWAAPNEATIIQIFNSEMIVQHNSGDAVYCGGGTVNVLFGTLTNEVICTGHHLHRAAGTLNVYDVEAQDTNETPVTLRTSGTIVWMQGDRAAYYIAGPHADDIDVGPLTRHTPLPGAAGGSIESDGSGWIRVAGIALARLLSWARGSIIRGGAAAWEALSAKTLGFLVQGDGNDVVSGPFDWDVISGAAGADVVHDHTTSAEGGALSVGGGNPAFGVDGALVVETDVGAYVVPTTGTIAYVFIYCKTPGTASSTIVDVHKNGVTIFTTQANRPTLAWNDADQVAKSGVPDIAAIAENDLLTVDIDQVATGAADLTVVIQMSQSSGGSGGIPASPADIYVSASGDDSNDGLTTATPLETLQAAVNLVESTYDRDVTIHVASGDHLLTGTTIADKRPLYPGHRLLIRGYLNAADDQFTDAADFSGTFSAGATNGWPTSTSRATDATKNFGGADAMKLSLLHLTGGPGYDAADDEFNWYEIDSSGATTLDIAGNWNGATPTNATTYEVYNINNCRLYGNAANSAPMITISGSQNIVLRFLQILNGTLAWGPGTAGYHTVKVLSHSMTAQPTGYQGVSNPDLIWLGLLLGTPGTDSWTLMIQDSQLAIWAAAVSGYTTSALVTGNIAFSGQLDLRHVIIENADTFGIYAIGGTLTYFNGRVENNTESVGFRAGICMDARSLIIEGHSLVVKDSYIGIQSLATSHVYLAGNNLIDSNGGDGVLSEASSQVELNGAGNTVSNNGGYGAHAIHNSAANVSGATYAGNASGTYAADASSAAW